ncbi:MAG: hypothetical protein IPJ75_15290 [Ignavibacteriales bacterium]|nr:hypothetical protein [Ignavibacteriales bacterium]
MAIITGPIPPSARFEDGAEVRYCHEITGIPSMRIFKRIKYRPVPG